MDALTSHCSMRFSLLGEKSSFSPCSNAISIPFFKDLEKKMGSDLAISTSIPPARSLASSSLEGLTGDDIMDSRMRTAYAASNAVRVRFVLHKACSFGQQFLLVGDDPMFGLWDPSNAIPLEWSHGDVWAAQLDLPVGKSIQFKFILRGFLGEINWQPGPDRILRVWETTNAIVVTEDWDKAENQKITEQDKTLLTTLPSENNIGRTLLGDAHLTLIDDDELQLPTYEGDGHILVPDLAGASFFPKEVANKENDDVL